MDRINLPKNVNLIIKLLEGEGHEAFAVGGCVRDALMGREPNDWDITTSAAPSDIKGIFHKTIDTGIQHGTVTVMLERIGYEVTTYRIDGSYSDGRHPDKVVFTNNLVEDLKRRDFTINAMAYNDRAGIVDEFDGVGDLERKLIKCVGNPVERFTEDALRMLRAVRFAAKLGFSIEEGTASAIKELAPTISKISKERIRTELDKLITSDNPHVLKQVHELQIDKHIMRACVVTLEDAYDCVVRIMEHMLPISCLRWAAFMYFEKDCRTVLKELKFDNKTINVCGRLVDNKLYFDDFAKKAEAVTGVSDISSAKKYLIRKLLVDMGADIFEEYYIPFMRAVVKSGISAVSQDELIEIEVLYNEIISSKDCIAKNQMAVKGADLKEAGVEPGKVMGEVIDRMFEEILKNPLLNERSVLLQMINT